ncbi:MAG: AAA family ATPase [Bacteroidota bacterium]|nr:AAA family ATPase [Bacteroidota bacterium]
MESKLELKQVIEDFNLLVSKGEIKSLNLAAQAMGISGSRLSQFLSGSYKGNIQETTEIVGNYIQLVGERKSIVEKVDFVMTKNAKKVLDLARLIHIEKGLGVLTGRAGLGKSMALQRYKAGHKDVIYLEVNTTFSAKILLSKICQQCGLISKGHLNYLLDSIIDRLKDTGRLLIVDQAEYLPDKALDILRTIHDEAGIGLLLAGLPRLLNNIKGIGGILEQIYTRVDTACELTKLEDEDIKNLIHSYIPGSNGVYKDFIEPSRGNARVLKILANHSKRIALNHKVEVNGDCVRRANKLLIK